MQFPSEFDWISPSGKSAADLLHGQPLLGRLVDGRRPDARGGGARGPHACSLELAAVWRRRRTCCCRSGPTTRRRTSGSPPSIATGEPRTSGRSSWPPSRASSSTRSAAERKAAGRAFSPQTRDMNPIYTGKDVSFIDTKQAQRAAENTLLAAEKFATMASLARRPVPDRGDRQGLAAAPVRGPPRRHHRLRVGPGLPRPHRRLAGGAWSWPSAVARRSARPPRPRGSTRPATAGPSRSSTRCPGRGPTSRASSSTLPSDGPTGSSFATGRRRAVPFVVEGSTVTRTARWRATSRVHRAATCLPLGYRTYRAVPASAAARRMPAGGDRRRRRSRTRPIGVEVDPARGGAIAASSTSGRASS